VLVLVPHWLLTRKRATGPPIVTPASVAAFVAVALPWYALVTLAQGSAFVDTFFLNHNVERFTSTVHNHPGPFFYYVPILLVGLFPWSVLLVPAAARFDRTSSADLFLAGWALVPLAFFSVAGSKLPGYILPVVPPLAILMGRAAAALWGEETRPRFAARAAGILLFATTVAARWMARRPTPWTIIVPVGAALGALFALAVDQLYRAPARTVRLLQATAALLLLGVATAAPTLVASRESGRDLFAPAAGREVLVWQAWRTAWMAGYFYNDARMRPVEGLATIAAEAEKGPVLVVCGPGERNQLEAISSLQVAVLAAGPRRNALLEVRRR
jgi:4-amino-4-deoxy-L-arabinose transferase-like glycosyltransferase